MSTILGLSVVGSGWRVTGYGLQDSGCEFRVSGFREQSTDVRGQKKVAASLIKKETDERRTSNPPCESNIE